MSRLFQTLVLGLLITTATFCRVGSACAEQPVPPELSGIEIEERLGMQVPLDTDWWIRAGGR